MKVTFKIDTTESTLKQLVKQKEAIISVFDTILGDSQEQIPQEPEKPKRKRRSKAEMQAEKDKEAVAQQDTPGDDITFEELASTAADAIKKLKDANKPTGVIVKKLKSFGASKLDQLGEEHYKSMLEFLGKL